MTKKSKHINWKTRQIHSGLGSLLQQLKEGQDGGSDDEDDNNDEDDNGNEDGGEKQEGSLETTGKSNSEGRVDSIGKGELSKEKGSGDDDDDPPDEKKIVKIKRPHEEEVSLPIFLFHFIRLVQFDCPCPRL